MNFLNKKIFMIGGAGLIGSHICDKLKETNVKKVTIYDNFSRGKLDNLKILDDSRFNLINGDIIYQEQLKYCMKDHTDVIHLAASWLNHCQEYPQVAFQQNLEGTNNVFKACVECNIDNIVFSSSASVYGDPDKPKLTEDSPYNNTTFYGATKIAGEQLLKAYCNKYKIKGVALRYFNVYGPRQDYEGAYISVITKMVDAALSGNPLVVYGDGKQSFDFIYVGDIAKANLKALDYTCSTYDYFNVCTGKTTSIINIANMISKVCKIKPNIEYIKGDFPVSFRLGDSNKATKKLKFSSKTSLEDGLQFLIDWMKNEKTL
jgi:UDP-glucose 4-epimerase